MKNIKKQLQYFALVVVAAFSLGVATPLVSTAEAKCTGSRVLTFPTWQNGMPGTCENPKIEKLSDFWIIVMNGIEILLQLVAYVSAGYIIWGGFKYMKSEGDPGKISESKAAILNAIFGLSIALASVAIVQFISGRIAA
ncbi:TPA: hypothetical protein DCF80_02605 [Candidatus Saccharibacteria bacterium]|nr:hypothetical protein [Candidatus Saccharibacteria bacterium]HRK40572.1 hypothetical protein [Candidatus Saccharibacteria bacterium]